MLNSFRMDAACRVQLQGPAGVPAQVYEPTYVGWACHAKLVELLSIAGVWTRASRVHCLMHPDIFHTGLLGVGQECATASLIVKLLEVVCLCTADEMLACFLAAGRR